MVSRARQSHPQWGTKGIKPELDSMENKEIKEVLMKSLTLDEVHVMGDGSHFEVIVVGVFFSTMNRIKREQAVYVPLMEYILDHRIHALSIKAYTPEEWVRYRKLNRLF